GWQSHPFFTQRGYRILPTLLGPGATNAAIDPNGHGTGESANIFAAAPDITFRMVKNGVDAVGAFNIAANTNPKPHIISCSWGWSVQTPNQMTAYHQTLAAAIAAAVANGIIVVFSAGNGHFGFPGQHPLVISAGGVYKSPTGVNTASNYSSGFLSQIYAGRRVPDVSGLVGQLPRAAYIMLPIPDGCQIDTGSAGGTHPNGDETTTNDGWAAFSGTSAAAPQIAGVCALMKKKRSTLTPAQAKTILMKTAIDVTTGNCNPATGGHPATVGPDLATGRGLVNALVAVTNT
ncbi:MAG: S8 family serine peptidase, partial [Saprospiraceae bacterium]